MAIAQTERMLVVLLQLLEHNIHKLMRQRAGRSRR
jgi:hypothetical protein